MTICFINKDELEQLKLCASPLEKEDSEIAKYNIEVEKLLENYPPMISSSQNGNFVTFSQNISTIDSGV